MDIKLKKSSKRLAAVILVFLICVSGFTATITIGSLGLFKAAQVGDPVEMLTSASYDDSGSLQNDFVSWYTQLYWGRAEGGAEQWSNVVSEMTERGFLFYITDGTSVLTNLSQTGVVTSAELQNMGAAQGAYRIYEQGQLTGSPAVDLTRISQDRSLYYHLKEMDASEMFGNVGGETKTTVFLALSPEYVQDAKGVYDSAREELRGSGIATLVCAVLTLVSFLILCVICGKRDEAGRVVLCGMDRWFTELLLTGLAVCTLVGCFICAQTFQVYSYHGYYYEYEFGYGYEYYNPVSKLEVAVIAAGLWVATAVCLFLLLCLIKKAKAGRFFRDFLIVRIALWIWSGLKDIYYGSSVMKKVVIMVGLVCLCSATVVFFPVVLVVALVFCAKWVKQYEAIKEGVREVKNGNPAYKIPIEGEPEGELQQLAADINAISEGFNVAVKQELKNQRMKTELISNVSHDIKTPLTSIITYVDLLKKEGLDCEEAPKYLDILDQKSIRLKKLTEDLFEAAKASSGDIPVNMDKVELMSLLNQSLAEMDDRLASRGLEVIIKADQEKYYVWADGQLVWRVLENLFGNAIKYALENSRVYVDLRLESSPSDNRQLAILEMKNVSKNPLNIPADELMERFKRGDESRSTEGSGLGLSIARDLMTIQHGNFDLVIDGDLFKAILTLNICQ